LSGQDPGKAGRQAECENQAFDLWLKRGLCTLFGNVIDEPIPDALLHLVKTPNLDSVVQGEAATP
jgi:hypothetical protein